MKNMIKRINEIRLDLNKYNLFEILYLISVLIYTFKLECQNSLIFVFDSNISRLIYVLVLLLSIPKVLIQDYNKKELLFSILLILFTFGCMFFSNTMNLIVVPIILIGTKNSNINKIIKYIFYLSLFVSVIHAGIYVITSLMDGISLNMIFTLDRRINRGTVMFDSNNNFAMVSTCAIIQYIYLTNRNKNRYIKAIIIFLAIIIIFLLGQSNTSLIISMMILAFLLFEENHLFSKFITVFKYISIIFSISFSLSMPYIDIENGLGRMIDKALSGRIYLEKIAYDRLGWSVLPQALKYDKLIDFHIDNCYMSIALKWGIVFSAIFLLILVYLGYIQKNSKIVDYLLSVILIWGITENIPKRLTMIIVPIILFNNYYNTCIKERKEKNENITK